MQAKEKNLDNFVHPKLQIENIKKTIKAISNSHDIHISYLGNFAKHDIKNAIQSMDSVLSTVEPENFTHGHISNLKGNLNIIRNTLNNFSQLIPYSKDRKFELKNLLIAIELLTRNELNKNKITFVQEYPKEIDIYLNLPFQSVLQMFNNLVINAIKALSYKANPIIKLSAFIDEDYLKIELLDNGEPIHENDFDKIFDFGYSTTGGSGIGLYHAKYLCTQFNGKIEAIRTNGAFSKIFKVNLPLIK